MTLETIYILRHGFRANWIDHECKSVTGLPRDPPLAAFGEEQAREVAAYFYSLPEDQRPTAIFSSPFCESCTPVLSQYQPTNVVGFPDRCLQTSKPTANRLGIPIYAEHGLSEWFYPVEPGTGLHPRPSDAGAQKAYFPEIDDSWSSVWYPSRLGEGLAAVHDRARGFLTVLVPEVQRRFGGHHKRILLVSHAATIIVLARELTGNRNLSFRVACCSLTVLDHKVAPASEGDSPPPTVVGSWTARSLGVGDYLKDGLLRAWGFEDAVITDGGEVPNDNGEPGTGNDKDEPVGPQIGQFSRI